MLRFWHETSKITETLTMKHKILFVCHGNICRSPMAEFMMKRLVSEAGREAEFEIDSVATSTEEIGNDMYPTRPAVLARAWRAVRAQARSANHPGRL